MRTGSLCTGFSTLLVCLSLGAAVGADMAPTYGAKTAAQWAADLGFDFDPRVRSRAARALGWMGPDAALAVPALVRTLRDDVSAVRRDAAWALGRVGPAAAPAVAALARALGDDFTDVGQAAARALAALGPDAGGAVRPLIAALRDRHLATDAAMALGEIGPPARAALPKLRALARGTNAALAEVAKEAMRNIEAEPETRHGGASSDPWTHRATLRGSSLSCGHARLGRVRAPRGCTT